MGGELPTLKGALATARPIRYGSFAEASTGHWSLLEELASRPGVRKVCEVGGGATPALPTEFVRARSIEYTVLDLSATELAKAPDVYRKVQGDITSGELRLEGGFDLIFSRMLAEHVWLPADFHRSVYRLLTPGGRAFHFFSTLYALPFLANRLLPPGVADRIVRWLWPGRDPEGGEAKFPAFYRWCRGPTRASIRRLEDVGFIVEEYAGFFGHEYYRGVPWIHRAHRALSDALTRKPMPLLTSYAHVILMRP